VTGGIYRTVRTADGAVNDSIISPRAKKFGGRTRNFRNFRAIRRNKVVGSFSCRIERFD